MLAARQRPAPWTGHDDVAVRITRDGRGLERGRPADGQQPDADPVALVLIHPDTEAALTATLQCARTRIHGAWTDPYRLLTHAFAGRGLPADVDLSLSTRSGPRRLDLGPGSGGRFVRFRRYRPQVL